MGDRNRRSRARQRSRLAARNKDHFLSGRPKKRKAHNASRNRLHRFNRMSADDETNASRRRARCLAVAKAESVLASARSRRAEPADLAEGVQRDEQERTTRPDSRSAACGKDSRRQKNRQGFHPTKITTTPGTKSRGIKIAFGVHCA